MLLFMLTISVEFSVILSRLPSLELIQTFLLSEVIQKLLYFLDINRNSFDFISKKPAFPNVLNQILSSSTKSNSFISKSLSSLL